RFLSTDCLFRAKGLELVGGFTFGLATEYDWHIHTQCSEYAVRHISFPSMGVIPEPLIFIGNFKSINRLLLKGVTFSALQGGSALSRPQKRGGPAISVSGPSRHTVNKQGPVM